MTNVNMRIGIFGGTFDPVHYGHLLLAESAREQCRLDEVRFVPAATPPHKQGQTVTPAEARLDMLRLAVGGHETFTVCDSEIRRGGVSYTVDTLQGLRQEHPNAELFLLVGADTLIDLPNWREPQRVLELAVPVVVGRPGSAEPNYGVLSHLVAPDRLATFGTCRVEMPAMGISSRDLRRRAAEGRSIRYQVPRAVEAFITAHNLYRTA
jgi:nicotinate-nucleotide adenylyltransferase